MSTKKTAAAAAAAMVTTKSTNNNKLLLLRRKAETVTADEFTSTTAERILRQSEQNALTICNYILAMKTEINPVKQYKQLTIQTLCYLSEFHHDNKKSFMQMGRDDVILYLDSIHRAQSEDPQHKSVGTYNLRRIILLRFFRWLYNPNLPQNQRPTPDVMLNIPKLRRKEITTIKPKDLWTDEDHAIFLKYCNSKRDRAYHAIAMDSSCRPSEILNLKIKDLHFIRTVDNTKQYAQITVNGKTGTRNIPLFHAIPYIKDWLSNGHPNSNNTEAFIICSRNTAQHKASGNRLSSLSVNDIYTSKYKRELFPALLQDPNVPAEDKIKIRELLEKPFNPYIQRHSALTQKAQKLTAPVLKQHAGWSPGSKMETKYLHFLGAESNDAILSEIYGLETATTLKSKKLSQAIAPKICPQCNESNIPDSKFCAKCKMILTYDAYQEMIEEQNSKDNKLKELEDRLNTQQKMQQEQMKMQEIQQRFLESIAESMKLTGRGGEMERDVYDKNSVLYTDERYKKLNMTQEQHLLAVERLRQENNEAIQNTLLPEITNIAKGLQDNNNIAAALAAAKRILESKDFNERFF